MAKEYYDQPITASTTWGGDRTTGGKQVKGKRIQDWIKAELAVSLRKEESDNPASLLD